MGSEIVDIQAGLAKLSRVSRLIKSITLAVAIIFGIAVFISIVLLFRASVQNGAGYSPDSILLLLQNLLSFFLGIGILAALTSFFGEIANGKSPFSQKCVRLIRIMSVSFLVYALGEFLFPSVYFLIATGADSLVGLIEQGYPLFRLNLTALFSAIVFLSLSFAFSYGTKLQQLSDDTV